MAAVMEIDVVTGVSPGTATSVDDAVMLFNSSDDVISSGTGNALPIPPSGSYYSYWKHYALICTTTPDGVADNLRFFTSGASASPAGVLWWGSPANVGADAGYRQATGVVGQSGDVLDTTNHDGLIGAPVDIFGWTSGSPLALTGSITNPATGQVGDFVVVQIEVQSTAPPGPITNEEFDIVWDET